MIMKCPVLLNNELVTVVQYNDIEVQLPSIHREAKELNVLFSDDGCYSIIDDDYTEEPVKNEKSISKPKKKAAKKTTVDESAIDEDDLSTDLDE